MNQLPITARNRRALSPSGTAPTGAPNWIADIDNPYLHGFFAPVTEEINSGPLKVLEGEIPKDLYGAYFRNGPNQAHKPKGRYHWFDGDGMISALWFENGEARYSNRWVRTDGFNYEAKKGEAVWEGVIGKFNFDLPFGPIKDTANTDLIYHQGKLVPLWYESGKPYAIDPRTLATLPGTGIGDAFPYKVSAHSHVDERTGDVVFFGYGDKPPYMHYGVLRADGSLHYSEIELPGARRPHDLGMTSNYSILHDFPLFHDEELLKRTGRRIPLFHRDVPTRFGVLPRFGSNADVQWFECEPCYMLHVVNCHEEGNEVIMVGCRTDDPSLKPEREDGALAGMISGLKVQANLYEWRFNLKTGESRERKLDDYNAEFPMIREAQRGEQLRYGYLQDMPTTAPALFDGILKYDISSGAIVDRCRYGQGVFGSESPFAPRVGSTTEDDGYLTSIVVNSNDWSAECHIYHAQALSDGPVARVQLPHRPSSGFHTRWVPGEQLPEQ